MRIFMPTLELLTPPFQTLRTLQNHEQVIRILLEKGAKRDTKNSNNETAMQIARRKGNASMCSLLLEFE